MKITAEKRRRSTYWLLKTIKSIKEVAGLAVGNGGTEINER